MSKRVLTDDQEIRLHALNLAVASRRDTVRFSLAKDGTEDPESTSLAEVNIRDAVAYADWIREGIEIVAAEAATP